MSYPIPTLKEVTDRIENDILARVTIGSGILKRSFIKIISKVFGGAIYLTYGFSQFMSKQFLVTTAEDEYLQSHADIWGKVRKAAKPATGQVIFTGTNGTAVPVNTAVINADEKEYKTLAAGVIASGQYIADVTATETGKDGNVLEGTILTLVNPLADIDDIVIVGPIDLTGGTDDESNDSLLARVLQRIQLLPEIGKESDYIQWVKETLSVDVTRVWVIGGLNVYIYFVDDNDTPIFPTSSEIALVQAHIETKAPIGSSPVVFSPVDKQISLELTIQPDDSAVITNVKNSLLDMFSNETNVGETLFLNTIITAIGRSVGEVAHEIDVLKINGVSQSPIDNIPIGVNELATLYSLKINGVTII